MPFGNIEISLYKTIIIYVLSRNNINDKAYLKFKIYSEISRKHIYRLKRCNCFVISLIFNFFLDYK